MRAGGVSSAEIQGRLQWLTAAAGGFAPGDMARPRQAGKRVSGRAPRGECCGWESKWGSLVLLDRIAVWCERETVIRETNDDKNFYNIGGNTALKK